MEALVEEGDISSLVERLENWAKGTDQQADSGASKKRKSSAGAEAGAQKAPKNSAIEGSVWTTAPFELRKLAWNTPACACDYYWRKESCKRGGGALPVRSCPGVFLCVVASA